MRLTKSFGGHTLRQVRTHNIGIAASGAGR